MTDALMQLMLSHMDGPDFSIALPARPAEQAELLWVNPRIADIDPAYHDVCAGDPQLHRQYLLTTCALVLDPLGQSARSRTVHVDRYGGDGVGRNGGSGRALNTLHYSVKGVGRSPLVSVHTDVTHASGLAFLEEAVREVIFAEALGYVLPSGVSPILAIIGLNERVTWPAGSFPPVEQRVLIVRPRIARIAHLEQAFTYTPGEPYERVADVRRVAAWLDLIKSSLSIDVVLEELVTGYAGWARQYARCLVSGWSLGGLSPSNVTIDGCCFDFGGASRLPSIANYAIGYGAWTWDEVRTIKRSANNVLASLLDVRSDVDSPHPRIAGILGRIYDAFHEELMIAFGLLPEAERSFTQTGENPGYGETDWLLTKAAVDFLTSIRLPLGTAGGPQLPTVTNVLTSLKRGSTTPQKPRAIADRLALACARSSASTSARAALPILHRERLRRALHEAILDCSSPSEEMVTELIVGTLAAGLDDTGLEPSWETAATVRVPDRSA